MNRISVEKLKLIHGIAIDSGIIPSEQSIKDLVRDEGTLFFIAERASKISENKKCAAFLIHSIATLHPFIEANKRTAVLSAEFVMIDEIIDVSKDELNKFIRNVASGNVKEKEVLKWIESNAVSISQTKKF